ncbi:hypothetical protein RI543_000736 [Arxiozyma heterogenica]|uniref:Heme-copper oxidase subunit III family profile domain-containing protein n=1 Tax=Arxiozyma heterogenica TaxID=278026 RepID=A0AAN7WJY2_9SACH|nr:hypothetical protein RI543_000736 [Kazachstania heterogenica]
MSKLSDGRSKTLNLIYGSFNNINKSYKLNYIPNNLYNGHINPLNLNINKDAFVLHTKDYRDIIAEATYLGNHTIAVRKAISPDILLVGIEAIKPTELPLLNTIILLSSGATITYSHHALINRDRSISDINKLCRMYVFRGILSKFES